MARTRGRILALGGSLGGFGLPRVAWAHHPGPGGEGPWTWLGLLVAVLAFAVVWAVSALLEKRQTPASQRRRRRARLPAVMRDFGSPGFPRVRSAVVLILILVLASNSGWSPGSADSTQKTLTAYLRAVYARDYRAAYEWISLEDRKLKTKGEYVREKGAFSGTALDLSLALASLIRFENVRTMVEGNRATVTLKATLPDANAPEVQKLLLEFDEERLAALSPAERSAIVGQLREMSRTGRLPVITGEHERWELVREGGHWRLSLNWAGAVVVRFEAVTKVGLPWEFTPLQPIVRAIPGETLQTYYRVKNRSDREVTGKARHILTPPAERGYLQIISCFCFLQQTLKPGQEERLPVVFRVNYDIPTSIKNIRVRYEFYPLEKFPEGTRG